MRVQWARAHAVARGVTAMASPGSNDVNCWGGGPTGSWFREPREKMREGWPESHADDLQEMTE